MVKVHLFDAKPEVLKPIQRIKLIIRVRSQGARIESVPLKHLKKLSKCGYRNWRLEELKDDLLCLEFEGS